MVQEEGTQVEFGRLRVKETEPQVRRTRWLEFSGQNTKQY